jgi:hypothetical protein
MSPGEVEVRELQPLQSRQTVEQGIGRRGGQHLVAGVAEELEEIGVGLAGRRREYEIVSRHRIPRCGEGGRERLPRRGHPPRMRLVDRGDTVPQELRQLLFGIGEPDPRRVRSVTARVRRFAG